MCNKNSPWRKGLVRSDPSSNMRLPKTWSDRDKGKRGTWAVVEPTTKRHWPCRTKCLTATTASHYLRGVCARRPLLLAARGLSTSPFSFHFLPRFFSFFLLEFEKRGIFVNKRLYFLSRMKNFPRCFTAWISLVEFKFILRYYYAV